jgi:hypothetical protein
MQQHATTCNNMQRHATTCNDMKRWAAQQLSASSAAHIKNREYPRLPIGSSEMAKFLGAVVISLLGGNAGNNHILWACHERDGHSRDGALGIPQNPKVRNVIKIHTFCH